MLGFQLVRPLLLSLCLLSACPAFAQSDLFDSVDPEAEQEITEITPSHREAIAKVLGIPARGRHMDRLIQNFNSGRAYQGEPMHSPDDDEEETPTIFRHLRGDEGIALPSPDQMPVLARFGEKEQAQAVARQQQYNDDLHKELTTPIKIPECKESGTEKVQLSTLPQTDPRLRESALDILFVQKKLMQQNLDEVLGENVEIVTVDEAAGDFGAMSAKGIGAECLPYRVRVTAAYTYRHRGEDAVKDYREDPHGKGKLHDRARALLRRGAGL
ncbi:MAG: hypothetical protein QY326_00715 [Bdellovibrionota bacterium]|nr:MAG: hypothetical protein QY326_00715 [Bdellovibrionota bacterium]